MNHSWSPSRAFDQNLDLDQYRLVGKAYEFGPNVGRDTYTRSTEAPPNSAAVLRLGSRVQESEETI